MTLVELRTEAYLIINETAAKSHFTPAQMTSWANEGYRYVLTRLGVVPVEEQTFVLSTSHSIDTRTLVVQQAYLISPTDDKYYSLQIIDLDTLQALEPGWRDADTGAPEYLVRTSPFTIIPHPLPDSAHTGQTLSIYAIEFPADMAADGDAPSALTLNLQDVIAHYMAYRAFQGLNRQDAAAQELILVNGLIKSQRAVSTKFSESRNKWFWYQNED